MGGIFCLMALDQGIDGFRTELAVRAIRQVNLVSTRFNGPGLMVMDMGCPGPDDRLMGTEEGGDGDQVSLGPVSL